MAPTGAPTPTLAQLCGQAYCDDSNQILFTNGTGKACCTACAVANPAYQYCDFNTLEASGCNCSPTCGKYILSSGTTDFRTYALNGVRKPGLMVLARRD